MINLCTDPTCDETAALSIQRQGDVAPVGYCLPHGYQRENELKQKLENFRTVVLERPPSELEQALARVQELEEELTDPNGSIVVDGEPNEHGLRQPGPAEQAEQLKTALDTLEIQSRALSSARNELADKDRALQSLKRELERSKAELERTSAELQTARKTLQTMAPAEPRDTPPPPTRPDADKP